jgi:hypothetical protein
MYLGTNTSSSSDSQFAMARFFPLAALVGDGVGGGVVSILWRRVKKVRRKEK